MSTSKLVEVTDDLFDVASRLKSVNPNYKVYLNMQTDKYEVHDASKPHGSTFAFVVPYEELDSRTVDFAKFTRVQNAEKLFRDVEEHNDKIQRNAVYNATQNLLEQIEEARHAV